LFSVLMLTCSQLGQVFQNMTTNEMMNQHRYKYLQDSSGTFRNPFDLGCWPNTLEFFVGNDCATSARLVEVFQRLATPGVLCVCGFTL
ncbi:CLIP170 protein Tip1, partial [Cymbomonas tetramitiformis]